MGVQLSLDAKSRQNLQGLYIDKLTRDTQTTNAGFKKIQTILTVCIFGFKSLCFLILFHLIPLKQYCSNRYTKLVCHIILISLLIMSCLCARMNVKKTMCFMSAILHHLFLMTMYVGAIFANHFKYQ